MTFFSTVVPELIVALFFLFVLSVVPTALFADPSAVETSAVESKDEKAPRNEERPDEVFQDEVGESDVPAQQNAKKPTKKSANRPIRAKIPKDLFGDDKEESPQGKDTLLGGTIPALWEIEPNRVLNENDDFYPILDRDSIVPEAPAKLIRYAVWLIRQYDTNSDGMLQEEEWKTMPGAPQAIDLDGDRTITLDELIRHFALYGKDRTIHRPQPMPVYYQPRLNSSEFRLFHPITTPSVQVAGEQPAEPASDTDQDKTKPSPASSSILSTDKDLTEEIIDADAGLIEEGSMDDATYEELVAGRRIPASQKYHTPREVLIGVPAWFVLRDLDGDGQISLAEFAPTFTPQALALFGRLDKNGDGFITPDEVRTK